MATDAPILSAPSRPLPPYGTYLRAVASLGRRSIAPALPALFFLWFYHVGTELYLEMSGGGTTPLGNRDSGVLMTHFFLKASAYLPLLILIYTPFLPLQDWLLRGERPSFLAAVRHVLDRFVPFVLSTLAQFVILIAPILLVFGILLAVIHPMPPLPNQIVAVLALATILPCLVWLLVAVLFLFFAGPEVVLDGRGPLEGIRASVALVGRHLPGIVGRLAAFFALLLLLALIAYIPAFGLRAIGLASGPLAPAFRIAAILWISLMTALTLPFWTAALMVLYRAMVPSPAAEMPAGATSYPLPDAAPTENPHATPFRFE